MIVWVFYLCIVSNFNVLKIPALLAHPGLFWCFHTPLNSDMDNRIYKVHMCCVIFLHAHTPGGPWFVISSKGLVFIQLSIIVTIHSQHLKVLPWSCLQGSCQMAMEQEAQQGFFPRFTHQRWARSPGAVVQKGARADRCSIHQEPGLEIWSSVYSVGHL